MTESSHARTPSLQEALDRADIPYTTTRPLHDVPCTGLTDDTRKLQPHGIFTALPGASSDGHAHLDVALQRDPRAVIVGPGCGVQSNAAVVTVPDTRTAFARLCAVLSGLDRIQSDGEMTTIGITGTNGKSTTAHLLAGILHHSGRPSALLGTIQYDLVGRTIPAPWTTPPPNHLAEALFEAHGHGARHAVMEVSSHALAQKRTAGVRFDVGVFTNLTGDHLDYHGNRRAYHDAKKRLFDDLPSSATAVLNADDPAAESMLTDCDARVTRFGLRDSADLRLSDIVCDLSGSTARMQFGDQCLELRLPMVGCHNVSNAAAAAAAAQSLGISWAEILAALQRARPVAGRLQPAHPRNHPFSVFVDYAHTDDALSSVLQTLRPLTTGRLWCVFGCGGDRDRTKRPRMAAASAAWADRVIVTSDNPRSEPPGRIIDDILGGFGSDRDIVRIEVDRAAAIAQAIDGAVKKDVVLIAGKGHEDYQLIGDERLHFDDVEVVQRCLQTETRS